MTVTSKERKLRTVAREIAACRACKRGCIGLPVPGEGCADARVVFIGEAPGKEEAKTGRPFVGRSGKLLRESIRGIGLDEAEVFITSPVHFLPLRGTPSAAMIGHGREHLFRQLEVIKPEIVVLLGATACRAVLGRKVEVAKEHGTVVPHEGLTCLVSLHPAYVLRFPKAKTELESGKGREFAGMTYQWTDDLLTGIADIDEQHKELFRRLNALSDACTQQQGRKEIARYVDFLMEYVAYHFTAEEREMTTHRYPGLADHENEHEEFKKQINALSRDLRVSGASHELIQVALWTSAEWLANHVKGTDREMAEFLKT
jgi:hemerythrin